MLLQTLIQFGRNWRTELLLCLVSIGVLLLGESSWQYSVTAIGIAVIFLNRKQVDWWSFVRQPFIWTVMMLWLLTQIISALFSIHVPASLQAVALPSMSLLWLWFWSGIHQQWLWRQRVVFVLSWTIGLFGLLQALMFFWQPVYLEQFPRLNYLYNNFGHNHIAAIIILLLPFTWLQILVPGASKYRLPTWIGVWLVVVLGLAFSRLALVVAIAQLLIIAYYLRDKLSKTIQRSLIGLMLFLFVFAVFKQIVTSSGFERLLCEQQLLTVEFCRDQRHELRWWYWEQAWHVYQRSPIIGSGPGTFGYASRKFLQEYGANSAYAHNWVLAALAETGIVGFVATALVVSTSLVVLYKQHRTYWRLMSLLSLMSFWFLVLFDFDNQLFAVWSLVLCIVGLSVRHPRHVVDHHQVSWLVQARLYFQVALTVAVLLFAVVQAGIKIELLAGRWPTVLNTIPAVIISPQQVTTETLPEIRQILTEWYQHDADVMFQVALMSDEQEKTLLYDQVARLDPWRGLLANHLGQTQHRELADAEGWSEFYWNFYHSLWLRGKDISAEASFSVSDGFYSLADRLFQDGEYEKSGMWLVRAQQVEPWVLSRHQPFVKSETAKGTMWRFTKSFISFPRSAFGDHQAHYTRFFNEVFMLAGQESMISLGSSAQQVSAAPTAQKAEQDLVYQQSLKQLGSELIIVSSLAYRVLPTEAERSVETVDALTEASILLGEHSAGQNTRQVPQLYGVALRLRPWVMNGRKWWFERPNLNLEYQQDSLDFLDYWQTWEGDWIGHHPEAFLLLVEQGLAETAADQSMARRKRYQFIHNQLTEAIENND